MYEVSHDIRRRVSGVPEHLDVFVETSLRDVPVELPVVGCSKELFVCGPVDHHMAVAECPHDFLLG